MKTEKEYQIRTIEDFMNVVTEENIDMLTGNFYGMTLQWLKIKTVYPKAKFNSFKWIDDGLIEIRRPEIFQINIESVDSNNEVAVCSECGAQMEYDWHVEYNTCPKCGCDIAK
jgi:hypothetical protein